MHDLFAKYLKGDITNDEKVELFSLIENDAKLRKEFISTQNLHAISFLLPSENDKAEAKKKLKQLKRKTRKKAFLISLKQMTRYAAAIGITIVATWMVIKNGESAIQNEPTIAYEEFTTPAGQRAKVKLYDGTVVWLNARSSLRYPNIFTNGERRVELDGEAYFEVAHNPEEPFIVSTEKLDVKALGTEFNVHAYKGRNEFITSLVDGSLKVYNKNNEKNGLFMKPFEFAELIDNRLIIKSFNNVDFLLWKDGVYAFDDVPFLEIIRKLELYYEITIDIKNRKLSTYKFTGKFRQRDGVESVLKTLRKVYYFSYSKDEEKNIITIR